MDIFHLKADYDLDIMQPRQTLATITTKSLVGLDEVLDEAKPDIVLVHGDTYPCAPAHAPAEPF